MFSSDTKINRNFKNGPLKRHQDSYHRNESNKMNKNYHNKNSHHHNYNYKKRERVNKDYDHQYYSYSYSSHSSYASYKRKDCGGYFKRQKYDDHHHKSFSSYHYKSKYHSSSHHYHHLKDAKSRNSGNYEIETEGGEEIYEKMIDYENASSNDESIDKSIDNKSQLSYFSLIKLELLSYFDEKESSIQSIEEEYESLKAEKERLIEEVQKDQLDIKKEEYKGKGLSQPIFPLKKFDLIKLSSAVLLPPSTENIYKEPEEYPFYKENIITHERIKEKLKTFIINKKLKTLQSHLEHLKLYQDHLSKWRLFVRHKEEEEATQQYFASKRYLIEQQYGDRVKRSRRSKESAKTQQQKRRQLLKQEQHRLYKKERFDANRADIPTMEVFVPHSFEKRAYQFIDNNGYIEDNPIYIEKAYQRDHPWTKEEEICLVALFKKYRKDFETIASFFPTKTLKDVIWYYYIKKYELGMKLTYEDDFYITEDPSHKHIKESDVYVMRKPSFEGDDLYDEEVDITGTSSNEEEEEDIDIVGDVDINIPVVGYLNLKCNDEKMSVSMNELNPIKLDMKKDELIEKNDNIVRTKSHWNDEEKQIFKEYLSKYGKDWDKIASVIKTKTSSQVKNYFQNYRIKLNLYELLPEDQRGKLKKNKKKKAIECSEYIGMDKNNYS